jgi:hypothetical protein
VRRHEKEELEATNLESREMRKPESEAARLRKSAAMKARWADPEFRERQRVRQTAWSRSDEYRQHLSAMHRGKPLSEDHVAAIRAGKARRKAERASQE